MTTPVQPTTIPTVTQTVPAQQEADQVVKVASKLVTARNYLSSTLKVTVPAAATGALTALVISRRNRSNDEDVVIDSSSDYTNE